MSDGQEATVFFREGTALAVRGVIREVRAPYKAVIVTGLGVSWPDNF